MLQNKRHHFCSIVFSKHPPVSQDTRHQCCSIHPRPKTCPCHMPRPGPATALLSMGSPAFPPPASCFIWHKNHEKLQLRSSVFPTSDGSWDKSIASQQDRCNTASATSYYQAVPSEPEPGCSLSLSAQIPVQRGVKDPGEKKRTQQPLSSRTEMCRMRMRMLPRVGQELLGQVTPRRVPTGSQRSCR